MPTYDDEFNWDKLETGLPDDIDATIVGAEFKIDAEVANGEKPFLEFTLVVDGEELPGTNRLGCGSGWTVEDGGRRVEREDGSMKNFHTNSAMGEALKAIVEANGSLMPLVKAKGAPPVDVQFWDGMTFHWDTKDFKTTIDGEERKWTWLLPNKLIDDGSKGAGAQGAKSAAKANPAPAKSAAASKKAAAKPAAEDDNSATLGIDPDVYQALFDIAYNANDHDDFKEQAFTNVPEAVSDEAVIAVVEGSDLWNDAVQKWEADNGAS